MTQERHWIDNVADVISGRVNNTLVSLNQNLRSLWAAYKQQEIEMTQNEQTIVNAAQAVSVAADSFAEGIQALLNKIDAAEGINREDLSEELAQLSESVTKLQNVGNMLAPAPAGTPAEEVIEEDQAQPIGGMLEHGEVEVTPLAGTAGPTDAAPTAVPEATAEATEPVVESVPADEGEPVTEEEAVPAEEVEEAEEAEEEDDFDDDDFEGEDDEDAGPAEAEGEGEVESEEGDPDEGEGTSEESEEPIEG